MFVILLKEIGNIHCYFRESINGSEFDAIRNFKDRSGFSAFIFYSEDEAKERLNKIKIQFNICSRMEFEIVPLNELQQKIQEHFSNI